MLTYDSGDFRRCCRDGSSRHPTGMGCRAQRPASKRGKLRGRGIGHYLEVTAPPGKEMGGIRFEANGDVTIVTGTLDYGQGHAAPFAQVLVQRLGVPSSASVWSKATAISSSPAAARAVRARSWRAAPRSCAQAIR